VNHNPVSVERIQEQIASAGVKFVNLQFTDIMGIVKTVSVPVELWPDVLEHGQWFDGSSIQGFARIAESDMLLYPDLDTFAIIPWVSDVPTARVICDVQTPNGEPFETDPRNVLKRALKAAADMGYEYFTGPELEFFLFRPHGTGNGSMPALLPLEPHDQAGYFDDGTDLGHAVRRQMVMMLSALGIQVEALHHEVATGQHEIDFKYDRALRTADNAVTLRQTLKAAAQRNGLYATFMPKPIAGINGSGMHVHQSLWHRSTGDTAMYDADSDYGLSEIALRFIAGQLAHAKAITPIIAPLVNSYKRLVPGYEAPVYISWGRTNRSALIRIPRISTGRYKSTRCELRCPDPSCNPYLAFAVMLAAGLDGIENKLIPPPPAEEDLYHMDSVRAGLETLPSDLGDAIDALQADEVIQDALGQHIYERFIEAKTQEWSDYQRYVTQWELDRYLKTY
jgi:glutamine synthetase